MVHGSADVHPRADGGHRAERVVPQVATRAERRGQSLVDELIKATKAQGAPDNITVIWAEVVAVETKTELTMVGAAK